MKKLGFTLSEVIIALSVLGVVATITAPAVSNLIPDQNKIAVLKIYKTINRINEQLLSSPAYYRSNTKDKAQSDYCIGLGCTKDAPLIAELSNVTGAAKYPRLLAYNLDTEGEITSTKFKTIDGTTWTFSGKFENTKGSVVISVDIKDDNKSVVFSPSNKKPDTFKFRVDVNGNVTGEDVLTKAYLANPYKLNDRNADYKKALGQ